MDSKEDNTSIRNPVHLTCVSENSTNYRCTTKQRGLNEDAANAFASMSNAAESSSVSSNGPLHLPSVTSNEFGQSSRLSETTSDSNKQSSASQMCNKINKSVYQSEVAGSSKAADSNTYDNGIESNQEAQICQRHKNCMDKLGNSNHNLNTPSISGTRRTYESASESSSFRESRKRPSTLKINRSNIDLSDSSSDTGNDDYSLGSEDGCVYTYRGGEHLADLPSSFFSLDMGLHKHLAVYPLNYQVPQANAINVRQQQSRASSPDMDFLEMDFDPGLSCEVDTGDESTPDAEIEAESNMPQENELPFEVSPEQADKVKYNPPSNVQASFTLQTHSQDDLNYYNMPSTSRGIELPQSSNPEVSQSSHTYGSYITHVNVRGEELVVRRTMSQSSSHTFATLHLSSGDLLSPREVLNYEDHQENHFSHQINQNENLTFDSAVYGMSHLTKRVTFDKTTLEVEHNASAMEQDTSRSSDVAEKSEAIPVVGSAEVPQCMVWTENEARERQVSQIATSACGATAVVNVFIALGVPVNIEKINAAVGTRQRANNAPLPRYLLSRAIAGCTAADLVTGIQRASDGLVTARFFPTYPERAVSLSHWLADWIALGAVPILTLNLQVGYEGEIADAWHHQMVFGVSPRGVFLCNPVECIRDSVLWPRLTSPSVLLVRTSDIIARFTPDTDLTPLMHVPDRRFQTFNVLGQVVSVIRASRSSNGSEARSHVRLPAAYQAGVTVAALTGSEAHRRLAHAASPPPLRRAPSSRTPPPS